MAKDNFDLRSFLIENKMTVTSRGNKIRRRFLVENYEPEITERKKSNPIGLSPVPVDGGELEEVMDDVDFVDPEELEDTDSLELLEGTLEDKKRRIFDRLGIDQENFNRFVQKAVSVTHGNIPKVLKIVKKAYPVTDRQIQFLVDKGVIDWTKTGFGATGRDLGRKGSHGMSYSDTDAYTGQAITEDFADIANTAARQQDRYGDLDPEDDVPTPDTFGGLGSTSYEAPEDFGDYDEQSIRRSYTSLKQQGISDDRAMKLLSKSYDVPEDVLRSMFKDVFKNAAEKAVQVDEPKDRVSTFRMPKRGSAEEKAAAADMSGEFDDSEDPDEFVKPGETDDDDEGADEAATAEVKGDITYHYKAKDGSEGDLTIHIPENVTMYESEKEFVSRMSSYPRPPVAATVLRRYLEGTFQKEAASKGTGKMYMYIGSHGFYTSCGSKLKVGDPIDIIKNGHTETRKVTTIIAEMDCASATVKKTRRQAADDAKTDAQLGTATSGYGSLELSDDEIRGYVTSKAWNSKSIEQKLRDEYFPWSSEASEYMDDDEIEAAKAELRNEAPVDPESDWAKLFLAR